ncbi:hypothetical protein KCV07_g493, partial [Aureobasidium melanogenum]
MLLLKVPPVYAALLASSEEGCDLLLLGFVLLSLVLFAFSCSSSSSSLSASSSSSSSMSSAPMSASSMPSSWLMSSSTSSTWLPEAIETWSSSTGEGEWLSFLRLLEGTAMLESRKIVYSEQKLLQLPFCGAKCRLALDFFSTRKLLGGFKISVSRR